MPQIVIMGLALFAFPQMLDHNPLYTEDTPFYQGTGRAANL